MTSTKQLTSFNDFTNLYEVQKTLKFELKPLPTTRKHLSLDSDNGDKIFPDDQRRAENYVIIKEYIDKLHGKFIDAALKNLSFDVSEYVTERRKFELKEEQDEEVLNEFEKKAKTKKLENEYRSRVIDAFNSKNQQKEFKDWVGINKKGEVKGKLFSKELIDILRDEFREQLNNPRKVPKLFFNRDKEEQYRTLHEVFNSFGSEKGEKGEKQGQNFTTYFTASFHNNRKNYYKSDGKASRVATRIVDENLKRFCDNKIRFDEIKTWAQEKNSDLIKKFGEGWQEYIKDKKLQSESWIKVFAPENWEQVFSNIYKYILQDDINLCGIHTINLYNFITRKLNTDINESEYKGKGFQKLHKQVHGASMEREKEIEINEQNIISELKQFIKHSQQKLKESEGIIKQLTANKINNLENAYLSKRAIETISNKHFIAWHTFGGKILEYWNKKNKKARETLPDFIDLQTIKDALNDESSTSFEDLFKNKNDLYKVFKEGDHWGNLLKVIDSEFETLMAQHLEYADKLERETEYKKKKDEKEKQVELMFNFASAAQGLFRITNYLALRKKGVSVEIPNSHIIHSEVEEYLNGDELQGISPCKIDTYFRAFKDFVSKKPWGTEKIILYFDRSNFGGGWSKQYASYIFSKNGLYYLGICAKGSNLKIGTDKKLKKLSTYQVFSGKLLKLTNVINKKFPKVYGYKYADQEDEIRAIKDAKEFIKVQHVDTGKYPKLECVLTKEYERKLDLSHDIEAILKEMYASNTFIPIESSEVEDKLNNGKLYLFQIYNKDFEFDEEIGKAKYGEKFESKNEWRKSKYKKGDEGYEKGKENRDTIFFKLLFDSKNLQNKDGVIYKLSGGAKVFFRPATKDLAEKGKLRFKEDKCFLHVPIVCNFSSRGENDYYLNQKINEIIADAPLGKDKFRIIALDRGEKHLAYLAVLNEKKKLFELRSLNYIKRYTKDGAVILEKNYYYDKEGKNEEEKKEEGKNYHALLNKREIERMKARKTWQKIERIKDLKDGFLGALINEIVEIVIKAILDNKIPILVLENLNIGMMHSRAHIEKQIYQRLETRLAQKFNYLTSKKANNFLNAWQLVPKVSTYADIKDERQLGIMFYTNPSFTSATCPRCGYRNKIGRIKAEDVEKKLKDTIKISFDGKCFIFNCKNNYGNKGLYSDVRRVYWDNHANSGKGSLEVTSDVTKKLSQLFSEDEYKLNVNGDINAQIQSLPFKNEQRKKAFLARLAKYFNLVLQIRNSIKRQGTFNEETGKIEGREETDFIQCPICHFDSENKSDWEELKKNIYIGNDGKIEFNGDANGAYNIGRKGVIIIDRIRQHQKNIANFRESWNIVSLPQKDEKVFLHKNDKEFTLTILQNKNKQPYYCVLESKKEKFESIPDDRKVKKYPDLFINNDVWDVVTARLAMEKNN